MSAVACRTPTKMVFASRTAAKAEAKRAEARFSGIGQLRPYRCDSCGGWHLTHLAGKNKQLDKRRRRKSARA